MAQAAALVLTHVQGTQFGRERNSNSHLHVLDQAIKQTHAQAYKALATDKAPLSWR
jgi:hypothetical protein